VLEELVEAAPGCSLAPPVQGCSSNPCTNGGTCSSLPNGGMHGVSLDFNRCVYM